MHCNHCQPRYEFATWKPPRVNIVYHGEFDTRYYSVPYELARQVVEVRATANIVEHFHRGRRVASHVRGYGRKRSITEPEHMPGAHRAHLEWTPSKLVAWGASVGPPVAELMDTILRTRPHPEHTARAWEPADAAPARDPQGGVLGGAVVYVSKRPNRAAALFGYQEVFRALTIVGTRRSSTRSRLWLPACPSPPSRAWCYPQRESPLLGPVSASIRPRPAAS